MKLLTSSEVKLHLYKSGFKPNYWIWTEHEEVKPVNGLGGHPSSSCQEAEEKEEADRQEEEEGGEEHDPPRRHSRQFQRNADGKIIIRPFGRGWTPSSAAADAIRNAIRKQFRGVHHCWSVTPDGVKDYWWQRFMDKVSWDPCHHAIIQNIFNQKCAKRLSDMLTKGRKKGVQPHWIGDEAWAGLLINWASDEFLKMSNQNKTSRASAKGGAVHTTGRKSHNDVAQDLEEELRRPLEPDEFFLATHKRKSGEWVDNRSEGTYDSYQNRLSQIKTQIESSTNGGQEVDGTTKLELWKEVAGGKTRGRCYGTTDFSGNIRRGISSLTQQSPAPPSRNSGFEGDERATRAEALYDNLEDQVHAMMERMAALEHQSGSASCGASQSRRHPYYDNDLDDHSMDEASPVGRHGRRRRHRR